MDSRTPKERAMSRIMLGAAITAALLSSDEVKESEGAEDALKVLDAINDSSHREAIMRCDDELSDESWEKEFADCGENCTTDKALESMDYDRLLAAHRFLTFANKEIGQAMRKIQGRAYEVDPDRYAMDAQPSGLDGLLGALLGPQGVVIVGGH